MPSSQTVILREGRTTDGRRVTLSVERGTYLIQIYQPKNDQKVDERRSRYVPLVYGLMPEEERPARAARPGVPNPLGPARARKGAKARAFELFGAAVAAQPLERPISRPAGERGSATPGDASSNVQAAVAELAGSPT